MKKNNIIYHLTIIDDKEIINKEDAIKDLDENKYIFKIKYIKNTSEFLYNFNLPRYTQCFYAINTLYIVLDHLQYPVNKIADAVFFVIPDNISEKDLLFVYNYMKDSEYFKDKIKNLKLQLDKKDTKLFLAKIFLFEEKIKKNESISNFEKMMLKSRRVIFKIKNIKPKDKDIDYILTKGF